MLLSRRNQARLLATSQEVLTTKRCSKDGIHSPLLWSLVVEGLIVVLNQGLYHVQGYADDSPGGFKGSFPRHSSTS